MVGCACEGGDQSRSPGKLTLTHGVFRSCHILGNMFASMVYPCKDVCVLEKCLHRCHILWPHLTRNVLTTVKTHTVDEFTPLASPILGLSKTRPKQASFPIDGDDVTLCETYQFIVVLRAGPITENLFLRIHSMDRSGRCSCGNDQEWVIIM